MPESADQGTWVSSGKSAGFAYGSTCEKCDATGNSTLFIEFSLHMILQSLEDFLLIFRPVKPSIEDRTLKAKKHFGTREFSRKEYLILHKKISTVTASRDLKVGTDQDLLIMKGERYQQRSVQELSSLLLN
tara:strand:+ start:3132 stop:3524 length:393 start_codon:yes stop_codon:yes gene_type:complete